MCGQSGVAGSIWQPEKRAAENLMMINTVRGPHSTGLASIARDRKHKKNPGIIIVKEVGTPYGDGEGGVGIVGHKSYDKALQQTSVALISHNRWATTGEISRKNTHPFWFTDKLVGTHNGTLDYSYRTKLIGASAFGTDSECLFNTIALKGTKYAIENTEGAYAIVFFDLQTNSINMIRNDQRPLHYVMSSDNQALFWSSDAEALIYGLVYSKVSVGQNKVYALTPDTLMTWKIPETMKPFDEPVRETIKGFKKSVMAYYDNRNWFQRGHPTQEEAWEAEYYGEQPFRPATFPSKNDETPLLSDKSGLVERKPQESEVDHGTKDDSKVEETTPDPLASTVTGTGTERSTIPAIDKRIEEITSITRINHATYSEEKVIDLEKVKQNLKNNSSNRGSEYVNSAQYEPRAVTQINHMAAKRFNEQYPELVLKAPSGWIERFNGPQRKAWWDYTRSVWISFEYQAIHNKWNRRETLKAPVYVPFRQINVDAGGSHLFSYKKVGPRSNRQRVVSYKGYRGALLVKRTFDEITASGCISCERYPQWGNEVRFIDERTFLCEFCAENPKILPTYVSAAV